MEAVVSLAIPMFSHSLSFNFHDTCTNTDTNINNCRYQPETSHVSNNNSTYAQGRVLPSPWKFFWDRFSAPPIRFGNPWLPGLLRWGTSPQWVQQGPGSHLGCPNVRPLSGWSNGLGVRLELGGWWLAKSCCKSHILSSTLKWGFNEFRLFVTGSLQPIRRRPRRRLVKNQMPFGDQMIQKSLGAITGSGTTTNCSLMQYQLLPCFRLLLLLRSLPPQSQLLRSHQTGNVRPGPSPEGNGGREE